MLGSYEKNMTFEIDPDSLYVNCTMQDETPLVMWAYKGRQGTLTITEAKNRAQVLMIAAAIATNEAAIVQGLKAIALSSTASPKPKGFGKPSRAESEQAEMVGQMLMLIREFRPSLPETIEAIYGHYAQQPLIVIHEPWYGTKMQLAITEAQSHAMDLLGAVEASESDAFLYHFAQNYLDLEKREAYPLIQEFGLFRQRNRLEDLFKVEERDE
jgi:hypothetical protein